MKFPQFSKKSNPVGQTIVINQIHQFNAWKDNAYVKEGYKKNVIINKCVNTIARSLATVEIEIHDGDKVLETHPIYDLLKKPNPTQAGTTFLKAAFIDYLISGNLFITHFPDTGKPKELWTARPRFMQVHPGQFGVPLKYVYNAGTGAERTFIVDQVSGRSQVFHYKNYDPEDQWLGLSPMEAAALAGDVHNEGLKWNRSLLKNGARPSGLIRFLGSPAPEVIARLTEYFKNRFQGAANAGGIPMLTNGAEWQATDTSPKDMDFNVTMKEMTKYIASVYGVPLPLVDNDSSTFNNMEQAKELLWTDTIIPLMEEFLEAFGNWIFPMYGNENLTFKINKDAIDALEAMRSKKYTRTREAVGSGILTIDEGREALDYSPKGGLADSLFIPANMIPIDLAGEIPLMEDDPAIDPDADPEADVPEEDPEDDDAEALAADKKALYITLKSLNYSKREIARMMGLPRVTRH